MKKKVQYVKLVEPSIKEARMRRNETIDIHHFLMNPKYLNLGVGKKYLLKTYGCQGNLADSEKIAGMLEMMGFEETNNELEATFVLFNTCAIRENAEERVFGELGRLQKYKKQNPDMLIGICGCMPQEEKIITALKEKFPQVDIVFGTHNISSLPEYLYDRMIESKRSIEVLSIEGDIYEDLPVKRDHPKKAWVNIMYGCDEFCTYCIVPYTRGKERSRRPEAIIEEVKQLAKDGYIEVTLLGQNVNAYGKDFKDLNYTFANLLEDLHKTDIKRIRYTTSHPRDLDDATIDAMALGGNIMPHLHLPVQSGSDTVLKKMNRKYTKEEYMDKINKLKTKIPNISLTTDIIVAFPGESEEDFQKTIELVKEVGYAGAYTFIYSPREGTPASKYPNPLTEEEKHQRLEALNEVVNEYALKAHKEYENKIVEVLVEGPSKNNDKILTGYTPQNMLVNFEGDNIKVGDLVKVKINKAYSWHLFGELLK
ncbi:MAG: tRNA (N6-isopentenyl adenosine(37)-C2)-methylthiotransferase MiaB [Bacilli bacterium]|nr:tRNA (N6-isopentenyl adenosine(37)-C2)-methylthiotransferase MiaB [Mollicutes bacterium]MDY3899985.1 tRNA (N6-isopentenyl adenosine(37)-C2)-methylthiotransferase MiaB [Bacilli bacterium]